MTTLVGVVEVVKAVEGSSRSSDGVNNMQIRRIGTSISPQLHVNKASTSDIDVSTHTVKSEKNYLLINGTTQSRHDPT